MEGETAHENTLLRSATSSIPLLPLTQEELDDYELSLGDDKENKLKLKENILSQSKLKTTNSPEIDEEDELIIEEYNNTLLDVTKLRESANLGEKPSDDLLRASDLRASQLRTSQIARKISSTNEYISQTSLTSSQQMKLQLYLGDLQNIRQRIVELLQSSDGADEGLIESLISLLDRIDQSVEANQINLNIQSSPFTSSSLDHFPPIPDQSNDNNNNDNSVNNNEDNSNCKNDVKSDEGNDQNNVGDHPHKDLDSNMLTVSQLLLFGSSDDNGGDGDDDDDGQSNSIDRSPDETFINKHKKLKITPIQSTDSLLDTENEENDINKENKQNINNNKDECKKIEEVKNEEIKKEEENELSFNLKSRYEVDEDKNASWLIPPPNSLFELKKPYKSPDSNQFYLETWDLVGTSSLSFCNSLIGRYVWKVREKVNNKGGSSTDSLKSKGFQFLNISKLDYIYFEVTISDYTTYNNGDDDHNNIDNDDLIQSTGNESNNYSMNDEMNSENIDFVGDKSNISNDNLNDISVASAQESNRSSTKSIGMRNSTVQNNNININNSNNNNNNNNNSQSNSNNNNNDKYRINEELECLNIGLGSPYTTSTGTMVGYNIYSYAISNLGNVHDASVTGDAQLPGFGIGDTIGFGLHVLSDELFVTKNGMYLGTITAPNLKLHNEEFFTAVISIRLNYHCFFVPSLRLACNFGQVPFAFKYTTDWRMGTCAICYGEYVKERMYHNCPNCDFYYCNDCMNQYLVERINSANVLTLPCTGCGTEINEDDLLVFLTANQFAKLQQFRFLARLRLEPNCRWCPKTTCNFGTIGDEKDPDFPMMTCPECNIKYCFHCSLKWHPTMTCAQKQKEVEKRTSTRNQRNIKKNKKWMKEHRLVKCKKCGQGIQKLTGCNHMRCVCGYEFCWLCGDTIINPTDSQYPMHYTVGACAGLQMSDAEELGVVRNTARVGLLAGMIGVGGVIALGLAVPVVAAGIVAVPVYGGYRLHKHIKKKKKVKEQEKSLK